MLATVKPRKNDPRQASRLEALEAFNEGLKANSLNAKRGKRAIDAEDRQRAARSALVDSKRKAQGVIVKRPPPQTQALEEEFNDEMLKGNTLNTKREKRSIDAEKRQRAARSALIDSKRRPEAIESKPTQRQAKKAASTIVKEELVASTKEGGLDLSDLSYQQIEALKEYGGLTGNMTREQVEEIVSRVSPLTEDGTPFVISTPRPKKRFFRPRRQSVNDIETGRKILL